MRRSFAVLAIAAMMLAVMCGMAAAAPKVVLFLQSDVYTDAQGRTDLENHPPVERNVYLQVSGYDDTTGTLTVTPTRSGQLQYVYDPTGKRTDIKTITKGTPVTLDLFTQEYGMFPETMYAGQKGNGAGKTDDIAYLLSRTQGETPDPAGNMLAFSGAAWALSLGSSNLNGTFPTYTTTEEFYKNNPFPMILGGGAPEDEQLSALKWGFVVISETNKPYVFKATDREMVVDRVELRKYDGTRILYEPGTRSKAGEPLVGVWRFPEVVAMDEIRMVRIRFHYVDEEKADQLVQRSFSFVATDQGAKYLGGLPEGTPPNITEGATMGVAPEEFAQMSGYAVGSLDIEPEHYWLNDSTALAKAHEIDTAITRAYGHAIYRAQLEQGKDTKAESYTMRGNYFQYDGKPVTDPKELIILNASKKGEKATRFVYERTPANFGDGKFTVVDPATNAPVDTMKPGGRYRIIVFIKDNGTGDSDPTPGSVVDATITVSKKGGVVIKSDDVKVEGDLPTGVDEVKCVSTGDTTPTAIAEMASDPSKIATAIENGQTIAKIEPLDTITLSVSNDLGYNDTTELTIVINNFSLGGRELKQNEELVFLMRRNKADDPNNGKWVAHSASLDVEGKKLTITIKGVGAFFSEATGVVSVKTNASSSGSSSSCAAGALAPLAAAAVALIKRRTR